MEVRLKLSQETTSRSEWQSASHDVSFAMRQHDGLARLVQMAVATAPPAPVPIIREEAGVFSEPMAATDIERRDHASRSRIVRQRDVGGVRDLGDLHPRDGDGNTNAIPEGEVGHRPVAEEFDIPRITFQPRRWFVLLPAVMIIAGSVLLHRAALGTFALHNSLMYVIWAVSLSFVLVQLVLSWWQRPFTVTRRQAAQLAERKVVAVIPCYNEAAAILHRTIYSLFCQTRLPDCVVVVDDGSKKVDYTEVQEYWSIHNPPRTEFVWIRQENQGKKHAQAAAFHAVPDADFYVTMDSDSALDGRAIEEGIKPFAQQDIVSVAGLEMAHNLTSNLLTRAIGARSLAFQLFAMSAQSVAGGNVIINPGAFSIYRGWLIHRILPAYLGETFFGVPCILGDDTGLTMFALMHGRAVHQPTAVSMPVYPETLSHHLRQWTRWMRASTIRTLWRMRYLSMRSYAWWFVIYQQYAFFASVAVSVAVPVAWPATRNLVIASGIALVAWPLAIAMRLITVSRSDKRWTDWLVSVSLLPFAACWYLVVLRQIRFYGMATCYKQGWVTRGEVEVTIGESDSQLEVAVTIGEPAPQLAVEVPA